MLEPREMMKRYGLPEMLGIVTTYLGYTSVNALTHDPVASAYAAAICENLGFYGAMAAKQMRIDRREALEQEHAYGWKERIKTTRDLIREFGFAEVFDTALVRPLAVGMGEHLLGGPGIAIGKWVADLFFFSTAHVARKKIEAIKNIEGD